MGFIYFLGFIDLVILALIIFGSFKIKPRTRTIMGKGLMIFFSVFIFLAVIARISFNNFISDSSLLSYGLTALSYLSNDAFDVVSYVDSIIDFWIFINVLAVVWGFLLRKSGLLHIEDAPKPKNTNIDVNNFVNKATEYSATFTKGVICNNRYINKSTPLTNFPFLSGEDLAANINKLYDLLKIETISNEELEARKIDTLNSILSSRIPEDSEAFPINVNKIAYDDAVSKDELKSILNMCLTKNNFRKLNDIEVVNTLASAEDLDDITIKSASFELLLRGYSSDVISKIEALKNIDTLDLFNLFETELLEYQAFKLSSRGIDGVNALKIKKALKLENKELVTRYLSDKNSLISEYETFKKEYTMQRKAQDSLKDAKKSSIKVLNNLRDFYLKNTKLCKIAISAGIIAIIFIGGLVYFIESPPLNSTVKKYISTQLGVNENAIKISKTKEFEIGDSDNYAVDFNYIVNSTGYKTNYSEELDYTHLNGKWIPINFCNQTSNQVPTAGLSNEQITSMLANQNIDNVTIQSTGLVINKVTNDFNKGTLSANFTYSQSGTGYSLKLTGTAIFSFADGQWSYSSSSNTHKDLKIDKLSEQSMINLFTNNNISPIVTKNLPTGTTVNIKASAITQDDTNGTASATMTVTNTDNTNCIQTVTSYATQFVFSTNSASNDLTNGSTVGWQVSQATPGTPVVTPLAPTTAMAENIIDNTTFYNMSSITVTKIDYKSGSNSATVTYTIQGESNPPQTATLTFSNGQWSVADTSTNDSDNDNSF